MSLFMAVFGRFVCALIGGTDSRSVFIAFIVNIITICSYTIRSLRAKPAFVCCAEPGRGGPNNMKSKQKKKGVGRNLTRALEMRVAYIHQQIYHSRYPTQESLAKDLEVSTDCIDRDIRAMRTYRKLP